MYIYSYSYVSHFPHDRKVLNAFKILKSAQRTTKLVEHNIM